jgi:hypothetical protein
MSVEKGPKTGPVEFAGVDITNTTNPRNDSVSDTIIPDQESEDFNMPEVDLEHAATLRPTRVTGDKLLWYITFVCGTGVSKSQHQLSIAPDDSSSALDMIKVFYRRF